MTFTTHQPENPMSEQRAEYRDGVAVESENQIGRAPILPILNQLHGGRLIDQMGIELARLVTEVIHNRSGRGAKLVLTLSIDKPNPKLNLSGREMFITADLKAKAPDDPPDSHLFYFDDDGGLHLRDPYQKGLFSGPTG